jgi:ribosome-associated translation inhibitor RaiA
VPTRLLNSQSLEEQLPRDLAHQIKNHIGAILLIVENAILEGDNEDADFKKTLEKTCEKVMTQVQKCKNLIDAHSAKSNQKEDR